MTGVSKPLPRTAPLTLPDKSDCYFYHSFDLPNGETIIGDWDFRGAFDQYIANYPLQGKTVLDIGTATGFLAFHAEQKGAIVTAVDIKDARDYACIPYVSNFYHVDRGAWDAQTNSDIIVKLRGGFWYVWHKLGSQTTVSYTPIAELPYYDEMFDVVFAGAILEHLSDPVTAINAMCRMAREAVIIGFTPLERDSRPMMVSANPWADPATYATWWILSEGLINRVFANLGFEIELHPASARFVPEDRDEQRFTIVARRKSPIGGPPLELTKLEKPREGLFDRLFGRKS